MVARTDADKRCDSSRKMDPTNLLLAPYQHKSAIEIATVISRRGDTIAIIKGHIQNKWTRHCNTLSSLKKNARTKDPEHLFLFWVETGIGENFYFFLQARLGRDCYNMGRAGPGLDLKNPAREDLYMEFPPWGSFLGILTRICANFGESQGEIFHIKKYKHVNKIVAKH